MFLRQIADKQPEAVLELEFSCLDCRHQQPFAMPTLA